eukprot:g4766.t1
MMNQNLFADADSDMASSGEGCLYDFKAEFSKEAKERTTRMRNMLDLALLKDADDYTEDLASQTIYDDGFSESDGNSSGANSMDSSGVDLMFKVRDGVKILPDEDDTEKEGETSIIEDSSDYDSNWSGPDALSDSSGVAEFFSLKKGLSPFAEGREARTKRQVSKGIIDEAYIPSIRNHPKKLRRFDPRRIEVFDQEVVIAECIEEYDWRVEGDVDEISPGAVVLVLDEEGGARPGPCDPTEKWMIRHINKPKICGFAKGSCFRIKSRRPLGHSRVDSLSAFYSKFAPERADILTVESTLLRFQGKEQKLYNGLCKKYGEAPEELILPMWKETEPENLSIGMLVEVNVRQLGTWFKGFVRRRRGPFHFDVEMRDGDPDLTLFADDLYSAHEEDSLSDISLQQSEDSDDWTTIDSASEEEVVKKVEQKVVMPKFLRATMKSAIKRTVKIQRFKVKKSKRTIEPIFKHSISSVFWNQEDHILVGTLSGEIREIWCNPDGHAIDLNEGPLVHGHWQWEWPRRTTTSGYDMKRKISMCVRPNSSEFFTVDGALLSVYTFKQNVNKVRNFHRRKGVFMRQDGKLRLSSSCCCTVDGKQVAVGHNGIFGIGFASCTLYNADTLHPVRFFRDTERSDLATTTCIRFSLNGKYIATGMSNGTVNIREVKFFNESEEKTEWYQLKCTLNMSKRHKQIEQIDWSPSCGHIRAQDEDGRIRFADLKEMSTAEFMWREEEIKVLRESGTWSTTTCQDTFRNYNKFGIDRLTFDGGKEASAACTLVGTRKNQSLFLQVAAAPGGSLYLFDSPWKRGTSAHKYCLHSPDVCQIDFSNNGKNLVASGGSDRMISVWHRQEVAETINWGISVDIANFLDVMDSWLMAPAEENFVKASMLLDDGKLREESKPISMILEWCYAPIYSSTFYTLTGDIIYYTQNTGIVYNKNRHQQSFFEKHEADISCIAISKKGDIIATGDVYHNPMIHVWHAITMHELCVLRTDTKGGVDRVCFSPDGSVIAAIGKDMEHTLTIFRRTGLNWRYGGSLVARHTTGVAPLLAMRFTPWHDLQLMTVSMKTIKFWCWEGRNLRWVVAIDEDQAEIDNDAMYDWQGAKDDPKLDPDDGVNDIYQSNGNVRALTPTIVLDSSKIDSDVMHTKNDDFSQGLQSETMSELFGEVVVDGSDESDEDSDNMSDGENSVAEENYEFIGLYGAQKKAFEKDMESLESVRLSLTGKTLIGIDHEIQNPFDSIMRGNSVITKLKSLSTKHISSVVKNRNQKSDGKEGIAPLGLGGGHFGYVFPFYLVDGLDSLRGLKSNVEGGVGSFEIPFGEDNEEEKKERSDGEKTEKSDDESFDFKSISKDLADSKSENSDRKYALLAKPIARKKRAGRPGERFMMKNTKGTGQLQNQKITARKESDTTRISDSKSSRRLSHAVESGRKISEITRRESKVAGRIGEEDQRRLSTALNVHRRNSAFSAQRRESAVLKKNREIAKAVSDRRISEVRGTQMKNRLSTMERRRSSSLGKNGLRRLSRAGAMETTKLSAGQADIEGNRRRNTEVVTGKRASTFGSAMKRLNKRESSNQLKQASKIAQLLEDTENELTAPVSCITDFGDFMLGGNIDGFFLIFDQEFICKRVPAHDDMITSVHGCTLGVASGGIDGCVRLWNHRLQMLYQYNLYQMPNAIIRNVLWNCDTRTVLVSTEDGALVEVSTESGAVTQILDCCHDTDVIDIVTHPAKALLASIGHDKRLLIVNTDNQMKIAKTKFESTPTVLRWFPRSDLIVIGFTKEFSSKRSENPCWIAMSAKHNLKSIEFMGIETKDTLTMIRISPSETVLVCMTISSQIAIYDTTPSANDSFTSNIICRARQHIDLSMELPIHHLEFREDESILQFFRAHEAGRRRLQRVIKFSDDGEARCETYDAGMNAATEDWLGEWSTVEAQNNCLLIFSRAKNQNSHTTELVDSSNGAEKKMDLTGLTLQRYTSDRNLGFPNVSSARFNNEGNVLFISNKGRPSFSQYRLKKVDLRKQEDDATTGSSRVEMKTSIVYGAERDQVRF